MDCLVLDVFVQRSYTWGIFWAHRLFFTLSQNYFDVSRLLFVQLKTIHKNHHGYNLLVFDLKFCCCFNFPYCSILPHLLLVSDKYGDTF